MKTVTLQLVTVGLENGQQGVFIGVPLITEHRNDTDSQVEEIWFSNVQEIPDNLTVEKLMHLIAAQISRASTQMQ